jgi:hypothetical protein
LGAFFLASSEALLLVATICLQQVAQVLIEIHHPEVLNDKTINLKFSGRELTTAVLKNNHISSSRNHMKMGLIWMESL